MRIVGLNGVGQVVRCRFQSRRVGVGDIPDSRWGDKSEEEMMTSWIDSLDSKPEDRSHLTSSLPQFLEGMCRWYCK